MPISVPSTIFLLSALSHFVILACAYGEVRIFTGSRLSGLFATARLAEAIQYRPRRQM